MLDRISQLMFNFAIQVRRYRNREMSQVEATVNLTERSLAILEFIYEKRQVTFSEIAKELRILDLPQTSQSTISQAISALYIQQGLVKKRLNPQDQRQPIVTLTKKGKVVAEKLREVRTKVLTSVKTSMELSESDAHILEDVLERGIENFDKLLSKD